MDFDIEEPKPVRPSVEDALQQAHLEIVGKDQLLKDAETALRHSLRTSLGITMHPVSESTGDKWAVKVLQRLEAYNAHGIF